MGINAFHIVSSVSSALAAILSGAVFVGRSVVDVADVCQDLSGLQASPCQCECSAPAYEYPWQLLITTYFTALVTGWVCRGWHIPRDSSAAIDEPPAESRSPVITPREKSIAAPRGIRGAGPLAGLSVRPESLVSDVYSSW